MTTIPTNHTSTLTQLERHLANHLITALRGNKWRTTSNPPRLEPKLRDSASYVWRARVKNTPMVLELIIPAESMPDGRIAVARALTLHERPFRRALLWASSERLVCSRCWHQPFDAPYTSHTRCAFAELMRGTSQLFDRRTQGLELARRHGWARRHERLAELLMAAAREL